MDRIGMLPSEVSKKGTLAYNRNSYRFEDNFKGFYHLLGCELLGLALETSFKNGNIVKTGDVKFNLNAGRYGEWVVK